MSAVQIQAISAEVLRQNPVESMRVLLTKERINELGRIMETEAGRSAIVEALRKKGMTEVFLQGLKDEKIATKIADYMRSKEGREVMGRLARTIEGGDLIGALYKSKEGQRMFIRIMTGSGIPFAEIEKKGWLPELELDFKGIELARWILLNQTYSDVREQKLPKIVRTEFGKRFEVFLEGRGKDTLTDSKFSKDVAKFLSSKETYNEAKSIFRKFIKTEKNRRRLIEIMVSPEGIGTLQEATKVKEGVDVVGYLWNTKDGRRLFRELIARPGGVITAFNVMQNQLKASKHLQDKIIARILSTERVQSFVKKEVQKLQEIIREIEKEEKEKRGRAEHLKP